MITFCEIIKSGDMISLKCEKEFTFSTTFHKDAPLLFNQENTMIVFPDGQNFPFNEYLLGQLLLRAQILEGYNMKLNLVFIEEVIVGTPDMMSKLGMAVMKHHLNFITNNPIHDYRDENGSGVHKNRITV